MITPMKKYTFLVFHRDYDAFLEELREAGVVHVTQKAAGEAEDADLQALIARRAELKHLLKQGCTDQMLQEKSNLEQQIASARKEAERVAVWGDFSSETVSKLAEAGYSLYYYICPKKDFQEEWGVPVHETKDKVYFVSTCNRDATETLACVKIPQSVSEIRQEIEALNTHLAEANTGIEAWRSENAEKLESELKDIEQQIDWKQVTLNTESGANGALCVLEGFCPVDETSALEAKLQALSAALYYESEDPKPEDATPIKLHNNWFTKLFEPLTGMYGWPNYGEFDPTPILGPFFLLFFAMCMGDAGYGLLLILFGILTTKKVLKIEMFEGLGPLITTLGIGTFVVGLFLGTFFGISLYDAAWVPDSVKSLILHGNIAGFDVQMVLALGIGVFHICLAMTVKAICYTVQNGFKETVSVWGWLLLILGGLVVAALALTEIFTPEVTNIALIIVGAVSALGIFIFNTPGRNPLINIGAGLWDTYQMATGILGDVLSYIRLYALGLAGGMLGAAFNNLGAMVLGDNPTWHWLPFIIILVFGHALNLAMSALGAFVHPLRLTFVEYFKNSGYEGKGKLYTPFKK